MQSEKNTTERDRRKRETRRKILDAARKVFARDGIMAATTVSVAQEAKVSHGSIFVHFETQEGLVVAVIEDFGEFVARRLHELVAAGARTKEVLMAHMEGIREQEDLYARLVTEAPLLPEQVRDSLVLIQSTIAFHLFSAFAADEKDGNIRALPQNLLFNTWIGLLGYYLANRELFAPGASVIERRGGELLNYFMKLIGKEERDEHE